MTEDVMRKHIDLYVNNFSIDLGEEGKESIRTLLNLNKNSSEDIFVSD